jgi:cyclic dehypoxanthinyl futalosine synthase
MERKIKRLNSNNALKLFAEPDIIKTGLIANEVKKSFHPDTNPVTFIIDRNINYTNICTCKCKFCAFYRNKDHPQGYVLEYDEIKHKIDELVSQGGTQVLLQGGLNTDLPFDYYKKLLTSIRKDFSDIAIHAFSPPEIHFIAKQNSLSVKETLTELVNCGLSSIPGGGAEILCDHIRKKISTDKITSSQWLDVMETAHNLSLKTTATMVFGFNEKPQDIIEHLLKIRNLQDKTGGFTAFIPWSFQPLNTALTETAKTTPYDYLKTLAISRIFLDNIKNIQSSWVTQGLKIANISLFFGANDFGGTMIEENVVRSAGICNRTNAGELIKLAHNAGFDAAQRDTAYNILKIHKKRS